MTESEATRLRVEVVRSGGFAGISARWMADTDDLPADDAEILRRLVAASPTRPAATHQPGAADRFTYAVRISGGERPGEVRMPEPLPGALRALVDWVADRAQPA